MTETRFLALSDGHPIAYRFIPGEGPALVFLPGYMSDMAGGKATAVFEWARRHGRACLLLDYSGCGESPGDFADGTLSRWKEEVLSLIDALELGEVVLVGSSMGGWLMLLADGQTIWEDNPYGLEPTPTHPGFWADGQAHLMLEGEIALDCPVRLLHGQRDPDVPWDISLRLAERLHSADVQVTLIKDGDHRLSRESDIALLLRTVADLVLARCAAAD